MAHNLNQALIVRMCIMAHNLNSGERSQLPAGIQPSSETKKGSLKIKDVDGGAFSAGGPSSLDVPSISKYPGSRGSNDLVFIASSTSSSVVSPKVGLLHTSGIVDPEIPA
jgi:hypothetical protein